MDVIITGLNELNDPERAGRGARGDGDGLAALAAMARDHGRVIKMAPRRKRGVPGADG